MKGSDNPSWKGGKLIAICETCRQEFRYYRCTSAGKFCSRKCLAENPEVRKTRSKQAIGRIKSLESRVKQSMSTKGVSKKPQHRDNLVAAIRRRFVGHVSVMPEYNRIRTSPDYYKWQKSVFERDRFTCVDCGKKASKLDAHHIIPFAMLYHEHKMGFIREDEIHCVKNGVTLCRPCHKVRHKHGYTGPEVLIFRAIRKLCLKETGALERLPEIYEREMELIISDIKAKLD